MEEAKGQANETAANKKGTERFFSKEQMLASERFRKERDIVDALLLPDETYTVKKVEQMIEKYRKGKVN